MSVRVRWRRVLVMVGIVVGLIAWPHIHASLRRIDLPPACLVDCDWLRDHEEVRAVLVVAIVLAGGLMAIAELRRP